MTKKTFIAVLLTLHQTGCLDLNISDEVHWIDTDSEVLTESTSDSRKPGSNPESTDAQDNSPGAESDSESAGEGPASAGEGPPIPDSEDSRAPANVPVDCGAGTRLEDHFCLALGPGNASLRFQTDEAARIDVGDAGLSEEKVLSASWSHDHWAFFTNIEDGMVLDYNVGVEDINGNRVSYGVSFSGRVGPRVAITEVLADPLGAEPAKEFVEISNYGSEPVDISGWMIDDNGDNNGDYLPETPLLAPGEVAIIVGPSFQNSDGPDPLPPPDTLIIALGGTIGSNGLKNSCEESVELYDARGQLISSYPGNIPAPGEGVSVERVVAELPDEDPRAFHPHPLSTSTPGESPTVSSLIPGI